VCHMPLIKNPTCSLLPTRTQFRADGVIRQARVRSPLAGLVALVEQVRGSHCRAWVGSLRITKVPLSHLDPEPVMSTVEKSRQTRPLSSGGNSEAGNRSRNESIAGVTRAVLALLAMFTHNHLFWIAGLLLAFVDLPDFTTPLNRMANALARMAAIKLPSPEAIPVVDLNDGEAPVAPARVDIDGTRSTSLQARRHEPAR
jgi:hypothetical protein